MALSHCLAPPTFFFKLTGRGGHADGFRISLQQSINSLGVGKRDYMFDIGGGFLFEYQQNDTEVCTP